MAQNKKPRQGKRSPAYSTDSMVVALIAGLVLIALGVLILIAAVTKLDGDIFRMLRTFSGGLAGTLSVVLPVLPIWGGGLIIFSTQKKPPVRPFVLVCVMMLLLFTIITLFTYVSAGASLMDAIRANVRSDGIAGDSYPAFLSDAAEYGSGAMRNDKRSIGGGLLGMLLAWPLWKGFGAIGGGVVAILASVVVFLFLIRLDVKGIVTGIRNKADASAAQREQQRLRQQEQELMWQQEQMRLQQEAQAQAQARPGWQQTPPPAQEPADPWQHMIPAGAANWNQTYGTQPLPPVQPPVQQTPQRASRKAAPARKPIGFQPTPEEEGSYAPPQNMPPSAPRKGLFRRGKETDPEAAPRRRGPFAAQEEDVLPGEATRPTRQTTPPPAQEPAPQEDFFTPAKKSKTAPLPVTPPAPQEEADPWQAPPETPSRSSFQRPAARVVPDPEPEEAFDAPPAPAPQPAKPAREGSFMARMQAAQAAKGGATPAPAPSKRSRKDTPSAWSQPDTDAGSASWREEQDAQPPRPSGRGRAHTPPAPKKQAAAASWSDTPPWEDSPEYVDVAQPAAPVSPVLTREAPEGAWQPELRLQPRRQGGMAEMQDGALMETQQERPYVFPAMDLLKAPTAQVGISPEEDEMRSRRLESTLQSFKVPAKVRHITHGPAISRFELELAPGVRVSKVTDLNRNIAMNLEVKSVRIEAPIPGKSLVGVEVPNRERATVTLREVLESEPMMKATKPLIVALGKDIAGTPIVCDLAKMPHLLIAGATGSGKSVCINTIINSLLYRCSPKDVRLILVDPKVVELQCYNGIPHLLVPVVSDPHKASGALAWAVGEMMDRYRRFQEAGVRAIDGYNESALEEDRMPRIVIVIDELADLMMTCKKDVEERICRLAQLARAAGIHLIVATQRPSVDVITGLIKANIPSRIAFKVSSNVDSRTILDRIGAEQLLGNGDMLYMPTGEFTPIRVQGCFLSDPEVNRITDFIRDTCPAQYDNAILEELEKLQNEADAINIPTGGDSEEYTAGDGSLLMQAIEMAVNDGQVSTSLIQRRLKLGYARAGRLVDEMEKRGIISQKDGAKPRMCLISREEFESLKDSGAFD